MLFLSDPMSPVFGLHTHGQIKTVRKVDNRVSGGQGDAIPTCLWVAHKESSLAVLEAFDGF